MPGRPWMGPSQMSLPAGTAHLLWLKDGVSQGRVKSHPAFMAPGAEVLCPLLLRVLNCMPLVQALESVLNSQGARGETRPTLGAYSVPLDLIDIPGTRGFLQTLCLGDQSGDGKCCRLVAACMNGCLQRYASSYFICTRLQEAVRDHNSQEIYCRR